MKKFVGLHFWNFSSVPDSLNVQHFQLHLQNQKNAYCTIPRYLQPSCPPTNSQLQFPSDSESKVFWYFYLLSSFLSKNKNIFCDQRFDNCLLKLKSRVFIFTLFISSTTIIKKYQNIFIVKFRQFFFSFFLGITKRSTFHSPLDFFWFFSRKIAESRFSSFSSLNKSCHSTFADGRSRSLSCTPRCRDKWYFYFRVIFSQPWSPRYLKNAFFFLSCKWAFFFLFFFVLADFHPDFVFNVCIGRFCSNWAQRWVQSTSGCRRGPGKRGRNRRCPGTTSGHLEFEREKNASSETVVGRSVFGIVDRKTEFGRKGSIGWIAGGEKLDGKN